jgi:predicted double-glycine peptidase
VVIAVSIGFDSDASRPRECGEKSLFTSLSVLGVECDLAGIEKRLAAFGLPSSHSLSDLAKVAESYGTFPSAVKLRDLNDLCPGAIVHMQSKSGHFMTFLGFNGGDVVLGDAPIPPVRMDRDYFLKNWSGNVLFIFKTASERDAFHMQLFTDNCLFAGALLWPAVILCVACFRRWHR